MKDNFDGIGRVSGDSEGVSQLRGMTLRLSPSNRGEVKYLLSSDSNIPRLVGVMSGVGKHRFVRVSRGFVPHLGCQLLRSPLLTSLKCDNGYTGPECLHGRISYTTNA